MAVVVHGATSTTTVVAPGTVVVVDIGGQGGRHLSGKKVITVVRAGG